jgi:hypothetical protein
MNIIDIINSNNFLKQLYPNGIQNFFLGKINLTFENRIAFVLHVIDKPAIEVQKWGKWGEDYNIIVLEISNNGLKNVNITDWGNNVGKICLYDIIFDDIENYNIQLDSFNLIFKNSQNNNPWKVEVRTDSLIFQGASVYIIDENAECFQH